MTLQSNTTGVLGEEIAASYLKKHNFEILSKNFRSKLGEIDIIAKKDSRIHCIEVKTRVGLMKGFPYESVTPQKIKHLIRTFSFYILRNHLKNFKLSIDIISIVLDNKMNVQKLNHYKNITT